ncbi:hypothetical protein [Hydrogenothermus marinus]|uniref:Uncharacterized protein n=1 Tax=Hydrogenothermus marinus TaxID=133270 RepID=A0A3M0B7A2_9AQUI|nr:hypothetical protein [Hydrogenothermus marinus]RMA93021.1 hypothetical protein CLV39_1499 [Hydrogenothermus marinus]
MIKIYHYDEENFKLIFRLYTKEGIKTISKILAKINDNIYLDWEYILEELDERDPIIGKRLTIELIKTPFKNYILISPYSKKLEICALIPV